MSTGGQGAPRAKTRVEMMLYPSVLAEMTAALHVLMLNGRRQTTAGAPFEHELAD